MKTASKRLTQIAKTARDGQLLVIVVGQERPVTVPGVETIAPHSVRAVEAWRRGWDEGRRTPTVAYVSHYLYRHPGVEQFVRRSSIVVRDDLKSRRRKPVVKRYCKVVEVEA